MEQASRESRTENLIRRLRDAEALAKLVGEAPAFLKAIGKLPAVARSEAAVLISGETGTGKELVARAIHYLGERAPFPFVAVNCGALPHTLLEDELFGHERGAFTDAHSSRRGLIALAERGTLLLDEVDALPEKAQVGLLRVLQDKKFRAVGSSFEQQANVRILASTNALLERLVRSGAFRADLYYRLCVFSIDLPPLRERKEDILPLASHFLEKHARADEPTRKLTPSTCAALMSYEWPGNVRELENAIVRGIYFSQTDSIEIGDLDLQGTLQKLPSATSAKIESFRNMKREVVEAFERDYLTRLMSEHQGNVTHAARVARKERRDLGKLLKRHRLDPKFFRSTSGGSPQ